MARNTTLTAVTNSSDHLLIRYSVTIRLRSKIHSTNGTSAKMIKGRRCRTTPGMVLPKPVTTFPAMVQMKPTEK